MEEIIYKTSEKIITLVKTRLWLKVLIGLVLGMGLGLLLNRLDAETAEIITKWLAIPGYFFLQMVKMIVIPLVFSSIIVGLLSSGSPDFLKKIGPRLVVYFVITTVIAAVIGFSVSTLIKPGAYVKVESAENVRITKKNNTGEAPVSKKSSGKEHLKTIPDKVVNIIPANPFESIVKGDMLGVVIFTIIIGLALLLVEPGRLRQALNVLETIQEVSMTVVRWAMALVPYAVFGLMTQVTAKMGLKAFTGLGMYIGTVLLGLFILLCFYCVIVLVLARMSPLKFLKHIRDAQLLAFSTSSSAVVMPLSIKTAEEKLGVKPAISQFIIPVGATINMDGTALYQVAATVFLAQAYDINLTFANMVIIIMITVGASIGAPSAPGVGIVILATILESVGIPADGIALIIGVDRILDMSRTAVNVTGDLTASVFFNRHFAGLFEE